MDNINNIPEDSENLQKHAPILSAIEKKNCFTVPEKYFDELPQNIQSIIYLWNLKNEISFDIPKNYFEQLPEFIRQQILLDGFKKEKTLDVPEKYFDNLSEKIQRTVFIESLKENTLQVPTGYFDELPNVIQQKILNEKETKVITFEKWFRTKYAYVAAAASVALLIGFFILNQPVINSYKEITLALTENEKQYVKENTELFDIDESLLASTVSNEGLTDLGLQGLSKEEVQNYLANENESAISSIVE